MIFLMTLDQSDGAWDIHENAQKWEKNSQQNFMLLHLAAPWYELLFSKMLSQKFLN